MRFQWVMARRPSRRPAWARVKAPPQSAAMGVPRVWARRRASRTGAGAGVRWSSRPGTTIRSARASQARVRSGVRERPPRSWDGRGSVRHAAQLEGGHAAVGAVGAPDLRDDRDVEGADTGEGDQGDAAGAVRGRRSCVAVNHRSMAFLPLGRAVAATAESWAWRSQRTQHWWSWTCRRDSRRRSYWGPRNNPEADATSRALIDAWQASGAAGRVRTARLGQAGVAAAAGVRGQRVQGVRRASGAGRAGGSELFVTKTVNSAFYGTPDLDAVA